MIKNPIIALIVAFFLGATLFAQEQELSLAVEALTSKKFMKAKTHIDAATNHHTTAILPETWYYRIYIYKELYIEKETSDRFSAHRDESIAALQHFMELENSEQFKSSATKMGKYLVSTYYNNAVNDLHNEEFGYSQTNYEKYKQAYLFIEPNKQFGEQDIKYQLALANGFMAMYESDRILYQKHYSRAKTIYKEIVLQDSDNWNANYNLGILVYNRAVSIIKAIDYDVDLFEVDKLQTECVKLFFESLPYMKRAHDLNPTMSEPIAGLSGIYFSLHEEEQYDLYKSMLSGNRH